MSIANQTLKPDSVIIFDDNDPDKRMDMRSDQTLSYIFSIFEQKGIKWQVVFWKCKWPHYNHDMANRMDFDFCWRLDDDIFAESYVLQNLVREMKKDIWAVGCSVLVPWFKSFGWSSNINELDQPNKQWSIINRTEDVDHLHCSFLYRSRIARYNLALSKRGFREETLFTYGLKVEGYRNLITTGIVWHLQNKDWGIRSQTAEQERDEQVFLGNLEYGKIFVLNSGIGDHIVFKKLLPELKKKYKKYAIACCYPKLFEWETVISIHEAETLLGSLEDFDIYKFCIDNNWKDEMLLAYKKMYLW